MGQNADMEVIYFMAERSLFVLFVGYSKNAAHFDHLISLTENSNKFIKNY